MLEDSFCTWGGDNIMSTEIQLGEQTCLFLAPSDSKDEDSAVQLKVRLPQGDMVLASIISSDGNTFSIKMKADYASVEYGKFDILIKGVKSFHRWASTIGYSGVEIKPMY